jgi:DNA-binding transcriptional MerR regulator
MANYSIKDLEKLSGVKAHTIRIWEKRYNIVSPARTGTNIRFYSDADLKKIINVSTLNHHGMRISRIAAMSVDDLNNQVRLLSESKPASSFYIDQLIVATLDIDEERFEKIINTLFLQLGLEDTITGVVYPLLRKIGILWQTETITPAHEHFISNLIRQKMIVAIDSLSLPHRDAKCVLQFLPEGEWHEIGLLFSHYLARKQGYRSFYLGQSVPYNDLRVIAAKHKPVLIITCITSPMGGAGTSGYLTKLSRDFPACTILVSGLQLEDTNVLPSNVSAFSNVDELIAKLR